MKIAVTGASGFIGQAVVPQLIAAGHKVTVLGRTQVAQEKSDTEFRKLELANVSEFSFKMAREFDSLMHLAWRGLPNYQSLHHVEEEVPAHFNFLKNWIAEGGKNIFVAGTCFEYGMKSGPLKESLEGEPVTCYGQAKDTLRKQLVLLAEKTPFALTWPRVFYVWGRGQSPKSLIPQLAAAVERKDATFAMSWGEQLRDFISIDALAKIFEQLIARKENIGVVNVGSGHPISVRRFVEDQIAKNKWSIKLDLGKMPYPTYEPMAFWADTKKLKSIIG